jgi:GT2 family glycosyltransferase
VSRLEEVRRHSVCNAASQSSCGVEARPSVDLTVLVLAWNAGATISACLASIQDEVQHSGLRVETIVVDNGSSDGTARILDDWELLQPDVCVIRLATNVGTTKSRNMALRSCNSKYVCLLDSDTVVQRGVFTALVDDLRRCPDLGIVGPRLVSTRGELQCSYKRFPTLVMKMLKALPWPGLAMIGLRDEQYELPTTASAGSTKEPVSVDHVISAAWMLRSEVLNTVGYLDERIFYSPEDVDYCLRAWLSGWRVGYDASVTVVHDAQRLAHRSWAFALRMSRGMLYYFSKHHYMFSRERLYRRIAAARSREGAFREKPL